MSRKIIHGLFKADQKAGLLQRGDDCHEGSKHHNRGVRESAEGRLDVRDTEHHHKKQGQKRRCAEGQFVDHDQDNHEHGYRQCKYHGCSHSEILLLDFPFICPKYIGTRFALPQQAAQNLFLFESFICKLK